MMINFFKITFNNRELALFFWLFIFIIWVCLYQKIRKCLFDMIEILFSKKIFISIVIMFTYISLIVLLFYKLKLWDTSIVKDTIYWTFGVGFVLLFNSNEANQTKNYFLNNIKNNIKLIIVLEFIINLYVFNIIVELILVPIIFIIVGMHTIAADKKEYNTVKKLLDNLLYVFGLFLLGYFIYNMIADFKSFINIDNLRSLLLPPILSFFYLPFIYFMALYIIYENIFTRIEIFNKEEKREFLTYLKRKIFIHFKFNLKRINKFSRAVPILRFENKEELFFKLENYEN